MGAKPPNKKKVNLQAFLMRMQVALKNLRQIGK